MPGPFGAQVLLGAGESRLSPLSAGALDIIFISTNERPGTLPKSVILPKISPPAFGCLNWKIHGIYP